MKELFISLIVPHAKRGLVTPQRSQVVKQIIFSCRILPEAHLAVQKISSSIKVQEMFPLSEIEEQKVQTYLQ